MLHSTMSALTGRIWLDSIHPSWFVFGEGFRRSRLNLAVKRALDLSFGIFGLVISLPVMALVAIAVRLDSKGLALFPPGSRWTQGTNLRCALKFRSMQLDAEESGGAQWAAKDDPRITRVGRFIRKFRLDELPQFFNVIQGNMSFVGPRPERVQCSSSNSVKRSLIMTNAIPCGRESPAGRRCSMDLEPVWKMPLASWSTISSI